MVTDTSPEAPIAAREVARRSASIRANPTFGPAYWMLGLLAAWPALTAAVVFALPLVRLPRLGQLPQGPLLGALLLMLACGSFIAHVLYYPAWSQTWPVSLAMVALLAPVTALHGAVLSASLGDPDPVVAIGVLATWLLLIGATVLVTLIASVVGRYAPSYSGVALTPAPLLLGWTLVIPGQFRDDLVAAALTSTFALGAFAAFVAWMLPPAVQRVVPLFAVVAQVVLFAVMRLGLPGAGGASRPFVAVDIALALVVTLVAVALPGPAAWWRQVGWPEVRRRLALTQ